jgi:hypothetical protein
LNLNDGGEIMNQLNTQKPCGTAALTMVGVSSAVSSVVSSATPCSGSEPTSLERTRFFPRQLVTPGDLTQDQIYFRDKLRRHNRLMHGWGVVCGARCQRKAGDCNITIESGYILDPYGDEIVIPMEQVVNVCKQDMNGDTYSGCGDLTDPWCKDVRATRKSGQTYYLAIRYHECQSRPVSVPTGECSCSDSGCEYTRTRDSFVIQVLDQLPDSYQNMTEPDINTSIRCGKLPTSRSCPPCPTDPWVILADFTLASDGTVASLDCFAHRRYIVSFAGYFFTCRGMAGQYQERSGMREMSQAAGLIDVKMMNSSTAPNQAVAVRLADGRWTTMPVYFSVKSGETIGQLLAQEGNRQYYDSSNDETYSLSELYTLAGAKPDMSLSNIQEAVRPLEGLSLDVPGLRVVQGSMANLLDSGGIEKLNTTALGDPSAAPNVKATNLRGVDLKSKVGKVVNRITIADVAAMSQADFIAKVTAGIASKQAAAASAQAREVWNTASRVVSLANAWKKG